MSRVKLIVGVALSCAAGVLIWTLIGGCNRSGAPAPNEAAAVYPTPAAGEGGDFIPGETLPEQAQSRYVAEGGPAVVPPAGVAVPPAPADKAPPAPAKAAAPSAEVYLVKKGDTLTAISRRLGVPVKTLMKANAITDPRKLAIGQKLTIPR